MKLAALIASLLPAFFRREEPTPEPPIPEFTPVTVELRIARRLHINELTWEI
jgi:hypothetical protein